MGPRSIRSKEHKHGLARVSKDSLLLWGQGAGGLWRDIATIHATNGNHVHETTFARGAGAADVVQSLFGGIKKAGPQVCRPTPNSI